MSLIENIKADQVASRIAKESLKATLLTTLLGEAQMIGKNAGRETTDAEVVAVVKKFIKGINDTVEFLGTQNAKATQVCLDEKVILEVYLPKQMTEGEIYDVVFNCKLNEPPSTYKGQLMAELKKNFAGQYDGKMAASVIDALLKN